MDTWGIPGQAFLLIYTGAIVAVIVVGLGWRAAQLARPATGVARRLGVYHLAYLVGGRPRVCETAVAALIEAGYVRTNSGGGLTQSSRRPPREPVELAVYAGADGSTARQLVSVLERPCAALVDDLAAMGYLVARSSTKRRRIVMVVLAALVAAVGLARLAMGILAGKPTGLLIVLFIVAVMVEAVFFLMLQAARPDVVTTAGRRVVGEYRAGTGQRALPLAVGSGVAVAVAVAGLRAFPDETVVSALGTVPPQPLFTAARGGGSSYGGSSCGGSSCGGGGGGGGGCGG